MIWLAFAVMLLAAVLTVAFPLYRRSRRLTAGMVAAAGGVIVLSGVLYGSIGTPIAPSEREAAGAMTALLEKRVAANPNDVEAWRMLGRSLLAMEDFAGAIAPLERAMALESTVDPDTLVDLGEAVLNADESSITGRSGELFEKALALDPANPRALFFGGVAAIARDERTTAADRWALLLTLSPPPEIEPMLRQRVAEWRGAPAIENPAAPTAPASEPVVEVNVSLGKDASRKVEPGAPVFIIARDPDQPSPPIAAVRRDVVQLPLSVTLSDHDSMIPGRRLSSFERLEIVARVSMSGDPREATGDWDGRVTIAPADTTTVDILIDRQVP